VFMDLELKLHSEGILGGLALGIGNVYSQVLAGTLLSSYSFIHLILCRVIDIAYASIISSRTPDV